MGSIMMTSQSIRQQHHEITPSYINGVLTIGLAGEFGLSNLTAFVRDIHTLVDGQDVRTVEMDFSRVEYLDSAAALAMMQIREALKAKGGDCRFVRLSEKTEGIFSVIHPQALAKEPLKTKGKRDNVVIQLGEATINAIHDAYRLILFCGSLLVACANTVIHPRSLRTRDVLFYMKRAGVDGLPIVGLIGMLMGLIIAFMSFLQLRLIGANIYVPALVSFAMVKELGPIMTAILVAGRSGSAFAAEIGTMVVNEEVDALVTMDFDPVRFLVVPKIIAAILVVPILTLYADVFGIIGGLTVGVTGLDLTFQTYITQSLKTVSVFDVVTSLIKAVVFAVLITGIGCQRGFQARAGAQDVGRFTTSAVVSGIFLIVVTDSIFAIVLYYIR